MFAKKKKNAAKVTAQTAPPLMPPAVSLEVMVTSTDADFIRFLSLDKIRAAQIDELREIWKFPLTKTPVFKDLPRLAQRIVVLGSLAAAAPDIASRKLPGKDRKPSEVDVSPSSSATNVSTSATSSNTSTASSLPATATGPSEKGSVTMNTVTTASIRPAGDLPSSSYSVYLNSSEIKASRASQWPATYDIRMLNIFHTDKKVFLEFMAENGQEVIVRAEASQLIAVEDSTRYFIIMQAHHEVVPKIIQNTGFAFYTREQAQQFLTFLKEFSTVEVPVVSATEFASVDVKHRELKIVPLIQVEPEGYIQQEDVEEIEEFTKRELSSMQSAKSNPEKLNALRESITLRLSRQGLGVIVTKEEKRLSTKLLGRGSLTAKSSKNLPVVVAIRRVVNAIASELETPEHAKVIHDELAKPELDTYEGEMELVVESIFQTIGHDSKTSKVFKTLTQAIIHTATYHIKTGLKTDIMTGDVRGPDGWQIVVLFAHDVINITHRRREKSLDSLGPKHQFWYEWVLHMVFDKKMGDLASSSLRISDIGWGPEIDPAIKENISVVFGNGNMIIA